MLDSIEQEGSRKGKPNLIHFGIAGDFLSAFVVIASRLGMRVRQRIPGARRGARDTPADALRSLNTARFVACRKGNRPRERTRAARNPSAQPRLGFASATQLSERGER